jgi:hypothetical protein
MLPPNPHRTDLVCQGARHSQLSAPPALLSIREPAQIDAAGAVSSLGPAVAPITHLRLNPLGRTPVDPTTNGVGTQIADFKPISTRDVTKPLSDGDSLSQLPLAEKVLK